MHFLCGPVSQISVTVLSVLCPDVYCLWQDSWSKRIPRDVTKRVTSHVHLPPTYGNY
ncbi:hypothetical protein P692DRAFT_20325727 [Suillus brevipes Sb2]|nr:hypothetical protein P692DRAFT_20325727 [Suillus brevipes Sb2]